MSKIIKLKPTIVIEEVQPNSSQITVKKFVDSNGNDVNYSDFVTPFNLVVTQGEDSETVKFNGISRNSDGTVVLTIETEGREIPDKEPFDGSSTGKKFLKGASVISSNDPDTLSQFISKENDAELDADYFFHGLLKHDGNNSDPDSVVNRETVTAMLTALTEGSTAVVLTSLTADSDGVPADKLCILKNGLLKVADKTNEDITISSAIFYNKVAISAGLTSIGGVITNGETPKSGLTAGKKYLGSDGEIADTGDFYIGNVLSNGVFILNGTVAKKSYEEALEGTGDIPPSATNKYETNKGVLLNPLLASTQFDLVASDTEQYLDTEVLSVLDQSHTITGLFEIMNKGIFKRAIVLGRGTVRLKCTITRNSGNGNADVYLNDKKISTLSLQTGTKNLILDITLDKFVNTINLVVKKITNDNLDLNYSIKNFSISYDISDTPSQAFSRVT